jgi:universal stress protein E
MPHQVRRILIAIKDLDRRDFAAEQKAAQLARRFDAELCLFHALTGPLYVETLPLAKQPIAQAELDALSQVNARLGTIAAHLGTEDLRVSTEAVWDYPSQDAVIRAAKRLEADLVVVDCPRHLHTATWFLHFTDWELLRKCPVPVLLIKNHALYHHAPVLAALDPDHTAGKPVTLDLDLLIYAGELATALDGPLHAVHAFNPIPDMAAREIVIPARLTQAEGQAYAHAHEVLDPLLDGAGVSPNHRHIEEGFTVDVIENAVRATGAEILVLGSVSRSGLKGLLVGNTAERMLDRLSCDMLIVKPSDFHQPVTDTPRGVQIAPSPALAAAMAALA